MLPSRVELVEEAKTYGIKVPEAWTKLRIEQEILIAVGRALMVYVVPNELDGDVLVCNHPPKMTLRRTDWSYAVYEFPVGSRPEDFALEARIIARMEDEMRNGAVIA